jgi:hypothetical protein
MAAADPSTTADSKSFDNDKWQKLVMEYSDTPCLKDRTTLCLLKELVEMQVASHVEGDNTWIENRLADEVVASGDKALAEKALGLIFLNPDWAKVPLLFTAGKYDEGMALVNKQQKTTQEGYDYGAIWALVQRGDLDKALDVAKAIKDWRHVQPDNEWAKTVDGCSWFNIPPAYPKATAILAREFAQKKEYDKSYEAVKLIEFYKKDNLHGRAGIGGCTWSDQRSAYAVAVFGLLEALQKDRSDKTKEMYADVEKRQALIDEEKKERKKQAEEMGKSVEAMMKSVEEWQTLRDEEKKNRKKQAEEMEKSVEPRFPDPQKNPLAPVIVKPYTLNESKAKKNNTELLMDDFLKNTNVSHDVLKGHWVNYLNECKTTRGESTAEKRMAGCYTELIWLLQYREIGDTKFPRPD